MKDKNFWQVLRELPAIVKNGCMQQRANPTETRRFGVE
jgi:hypothetical protein